MTTAKHRTSVVTRAVLAVTSGGLAAAGVLAGLAVQVPASASAVAPVTTPALVPVAAPAVVTPVPRVVTPTVAPTTGRKKHHTEDELRERAKTITTGDLRDGRGSMPDGGLTSGETQLVYGCEQGYVPASECG